MIMMLVVLCPLVFEKAYLKDVFNPNIA